MLPEGTQAEIIDNQIYMSPSPVFNHQEVLLEIASQLKLLFKGTGKVAIAPFDVFLDETRNAVQPDIVLILNSNSKPIESKGHYHGVPDLVIEILSPGNLEYDQVKKKQLYEQFKIKEYWMVNPETKSSTVYVLGVDGKYLPHASKPGNISSPIVTASIQF